MGGNEVSETQKARERGAGERERGREREIERERGREGERKVWLIRMRQQASAHSGEPWLLFVLTTAGRLLSDIGCHRVTGSECRGFPPFHKSLKGTGGSERGRQSPLQSNPQKKTHTMVIQCPLLYLPVATVSTAIFFWFCVGLTAQRASLA